MTDDDSSRGPGEQVPVADEGPSVAADDGQLAPNAAPPATDSAAEPVTDSQAVAEPSKNRFATTYVPPPPTPQFKNRRRLTPEEAEEQRKRRAVRRRRRRLNGLVLAAAGSIVLLTAGWVAWRTYQAYTHLQAASDQVAEFQLEIKDVSSIDLTATDATMASFQQESVKALNAVSDPFYRAASHVPWVGPNLRAIAEVTTTVHSLSVDVVPSLVKIAKTLNPAALAPKDSAIDLTPIEAASPLLQKADAAVNASRVRLAAIDRTAVVGPIADAVLQLWRKLDQASTVTASGARVARLLPPMLGSTTQRTYLVAFQNLAEVRSTGGIFGSFAVVRVNQGRISILDSGRASSSIGIFDPPIEQLEPKVVKTYTTLPAVYPQDVNLRPDFPSAAALFAKMYSTRRGMALDGVIATDPVALSYAMNGMAPIDIGDGLTVTSQNVVATLLSTVYSKFPAYSDQPARDSFLAMATTTAFKHVMTGTGTAGTTMSGLKQAAAERRILIWSAHSTEQADIAKTSLAGTLSDTLDKPSIGIFLNDATAAKLDYYLTNSVEVAAGECQPDGRRQLNVTVKIAYNPPTGLPRYVLGDLLVAKPYVLQTNVLVFAPVGGGIVNASQNGFTGVSRGEDRSREVGQVTVTLSPGHIGVVKMTLLAAASGPGDARSAPPSLVLTPGVRPWHSTVEAIGSCGSDG